MSEEDVKKLAAGEGFDERDQAALLSSNDKKRRTDLYVRMVQWKWVNQARKDIHQAHLTLSEQRIFMPPEITKQFREELEKMSAVRAEQAYATAQLLERAAEKSIDWVVNRERVFEDMATLANRRLFRDEAR